MLKQMADNDLVEILPYDKNWPKKAQAEIDSLKEILNFPFIVDIKHCGSTAIIGMPAKPIIDIIIGVTDLEVAKACIPILEAEGYGYWGNNPKKDRMFFVKGRPPLGELRTHHVHFFEVTSYEWIARPLFAESLNSHKEEAINYSTLKEKLAAEYKEDREAYTEAKANFVKEIVAKAIEPYIDFSPLQKEDLPLLKKWLMAPHVREFWDSDINWTNELIQEKFGKYIVEGNNHTSTKAFIIMVKDIPIGYIQYYSLQEDPPAEDLGIVLREACGIDLFIGEKDYTGKKLSDVIIKQFLQENLWQHFAVCIVDPETTNNKAIHVYEKCGFKLLKRTNKTYWMICKRPSR